MRFTLSIVCVVLVGCLNNEGEGSRPSDEPIDAGTDATVSVLTGLDRTSIDNAVRRLTAFEYVLDRSVKVTDESGAVLVQESFVTAFRGPRGNRNAQVTDSSITGSGDPGLWSEYVPRPVTEDTLNWSSRLLDKDPLVLTPQGRGYYNYTTLDDTTIGSFSVRRIRAEMIGGADRSGIQSGTFYVAGPNDTLVGFDIDFAQRSLLFDEESSFRYLLQEGPDGTWLPALVDVSTYLNLPLSKGQLFELRARYLNPK